MAGTVTTTEQVLYNMKKVKFEWTSSTGGAATDTTDVSYDGLVYRVIIAPGSSASTPSAGYDVAINDDDGYDILNGLGTNSSTGTTAHYGVSTGGYSKSPISAVSSKLNLAVSDAGSSNTGEVIVYIR